MARLAGLEPAALCLEGVKMPVVIHCQDTQYVAKSTTYEKIQLPQNAAKSRIATSNVIRNVILDFKFLF